MLGTGFNFQYCWAPTAAKCHYITYKTLIVPKWQVGKVGVRPFATAALFVFSSFSFHSCALLRVKMNKTLVGPTLQYTTTAQNHYKIESVWKKAAKFMYW